MSQEPHSLHGKSLLIIALLTDVLRFFGTKDGCLDQNCPFLHDRDAVLAVRGRVIENRKKTL